MHFITRMYSPSLYITTCHARDGVSDTPDHSNDIYLPSSEFLSNRRHRHRGMAASNPLHRDASTSRQPSSHSLHGITASNAALPSRRLEGLVGPLRPWSGSRSCGAPPRPPSLPFANALRAAIQTKMGARGRSLRVRPCPWILQAPTMRRTAGMENNIGTRVERREKPFGLADPLLLA